MQALDRYFQFLRMCGGCTEPRNGHNSCHFAVVCDTVETLAKKGWIRSETELDPGVILMFPRGIPAAGPGAGAVDDSGASAPGSCSTD